MGGTKGNSGEENEVHGGGWKALSAGRLLKPSRCELFREFDYTSFSLCKCCFYFGFQVLCAFQICWGLSPSWGAHLKSMVLGILFSAFQILTLRCPLILYRSSILSKKKKSELLQNLKLDWHDVTKRKCHTIKLCFLHEFLSIYNYYYAMFIGYKETSKYCV